jgi:hypothetical protein
MFRIFAPSLAFKNNAAISASAALEHIILMIVDKVSNGPLWWCCPLFGFELMKKYPPDLLRASNSFRFPAYEWMLRIMSLAANRIVASGLVAQLSSSCSSLVLVFCVAVDCWEAKLLIAVMTVFSMARP